MSKRKGENLKHVPKKTKSGGISCAAYNCSNSFYKNRGLSFYRFPGDKKDGDIER